MAYEGAAGIFLGSFAGALGATFIMVAILVAVAFYVYFAYAWMIIATKLKHKTPWLAWIPFANIAMMLQLGRFHWAWIFLVLVPILGWIAIAVLSIIATWRILEKRNYPGWFSFSVLIPQVGTILYMIVIGFVAWSDRKKMLFS